MNLQEYFAQVYYGLVLQVVETIAVHCVLSLQYWAHAMFSTFRIRVWRTGPVCPCTP